MEGEEGGRPVDENRHSECKVARPGNNYIGQLSNSATDGFYRRSERSVLKLLK